MKLFGIVLLVLGGIFLLGAGSLFALYRTFEYHRERTEKTRARLGTVKHKKEVPVYGKRTYGGPFRVMRVLKHWSRGVYEYSVDGKNYTIGYAEPVTEKQLPRDVAVIYLKKAPCIACVETEDLSPPLEIYALVGAGLAVVFFVFGISVLA